MCMGLHPAAPSTGYFLQMLFSHWSMLFPPFLSSRHVLTVAVVCFLPFHTQQQQQTRSSCSGKLPFYLHFSLHTTTNHHFSSSTLQQLTQQATSGTLVHLQNRQTERDRHVVNISSTSFQASKQTWSYTFNKVGAGHTSKQVSF